MTRQHQIWKVRIINSKVNNFSAQPKRKPKLGEQAKLFLHKEGTRQAEGRK